MVRNPLTAFTPVMRIFLVICGFVNFLDTKFGSNSFLYHENPLSALHFLFYHRLCAREHFLVAIGVSWVPGCASWVPGWFLGAREIFIWVTTVPLMKEGVPGCQEDFHGCQERFLEARVRLTFSGVSWAFPECKRALSGWQGDFQGCWAFTECKRSPGYTGSVNHGHARIYSCSYNLQLCMRSRWLSDWLANSLTRLAGGSARAGDTAFSICNVDD